MRSPDSLLSPVVTRQRIAHEALQHARERGGMTFLVDGMAGMGKTYLLRELIDVATAQERGSVMFLRADEIESGEPYSFIERLVASSASADWAFDADPNTNPVVVARECIRRLAVEGDRPLRTIIMDDAQWIDIDSQRVLRYMIPRLTRRNVLLAFGVRSPHDPESFGDFLAGLVSDSWLDAHHHVSPLTTQEISALTTERLGVRPSAPTVQRMLDVTGGSFLGVDSILSAISPEEIAQLHFAWDTPIRAQGIRNEFLLHQYQQLSPVAQRTSQLVCLAGHELSRQELAVAARFLGDAVDLEEAIRAEVLSESGFGSAIMPRHALLSQAVSETIPADRAREMSRALAAATRGYRSLRHTLLGTEQWDDDLHGRVDEFVLDAARKGSLSLAADVLRAALALATTSDARAALIESLALVHMQAKTGYLLLDLVEEIEQLPPSVFHEIIAIVVSAHRVGEALPMQRVQAVLMATPDSPDDRAALAFFGFMVVIISMRSKDLSAMPALIGLAKRLVAQAPSDASELTDPLRGWMVDSDALLVVLDCYLMVMDQIASEPDRVAAALPSLMRRIDELPDSSLKVDAIVAVAGAHLALGDVLQGRAYAQWGVELIEQVSEPWASGTARLLLADCLVLQGEIAAANDLMALTEEITFAALDVNTRSTWAALRAIIAAMTGQPDAAVQVERARNQAATAWEGHAPDLGVLVECEFARANGDVDGVLQATAPARVQPLVNTRNGFLTYRVHALIDAGRHDEASELIGRLAEWRGTRWHEHWGTLDWLRARLAEARGDDRTARWHYEAAVLNRDFPLPLGLTLADFGRFLRAQQRAEEASDVLATAVDVLERIGAEAYLSSVREAAAAVGVGGSPAQHRQRTLDGLTERERQIVEQLVKGRSNSQIAESLVVSVTTVRSHVSNVLRKLRVSSRAEVAKALGQEGDAAR